MNRWIVRLTLFLAAVVSLPHRAPAPLVYKAGEGWTYESAGSSKNWTRVRAKEQLDVAKDALEKKDTSLALKAARRTVSQWPLSDFAPEAQYIIGRCYEEKKQDEKAFKEYQKVLEKYPKISNYQEIQKRQFEIANRYLDGQGFKLWGVIPFFSDMEKTSDMYQKLIKNGPYSDVAAQAQMNIGVAQEKRGDYNEAVKAYEKAADRYNDKKDVSADALFKAGLTYQKQARTAEYDQGVAQKAIAMFTDFTALFPNDPRVPEAQKFIESLRTEQARGGLEIAKYYEKKKMWSGALVYYNEVLVKDPNSAYASLAKERINAIKAMQGGETGGK